MCENFSETHFLLFMHAKVKSNPIDASFSFLFRMIDLLIRYGADVHACNSAGKDSFMLACFVGHLEVAKKLRSHGATWDKRDRGGSTALHWAVDGGNTELIKWLIQDGAKVRRGGNGMMWACEAWKYGV